MPELAEGSTPTSRDALPRAVVAAVLDVPGVTQLEPTLATAGPRSLLHHRATDGLHLLNRAGTVDVDVYIATSADHPARSVAHDVQTSIAAVLTAHGYTAGSIAVSVLAIRPVSVPADPGRPDGTTTD